jgi:hypothetical protein
MKRVKLTPAVAYTNGKQSTINAINVQSVADNLFDAVTFRYILFNTEGGHCGEGAFDLKGEEQYKTWDASPEGAYTIVIAGLGLEILPTVSRTSIFED